MTFEQMYIAYQEGKVSEQEWNAFNEKMIATFMNYLHDTGYAVVVFSPDELNGTEIFKVESRMIQKGWEIIESEK